MASTLSRAHLAQDSESEEALSALARPEPLPWVPPDRCPDSVLASPSTERRPDSGFTPALAPAGAAIDKRLRPCPVADFWSFRADGPTGSVGVSSGPGVFDAVTVVGCWPSDD